MVSIHLYSHILKGYGETRSAKGIFEKREKEACEKRERYLVRSAKGIFEKRKKEASEKRERYLVRSAKGIL